MRSPIPRVLVFLASALSCNAPTMAQVPHEPPQYVAVKAADFPDKAAELVGKNVEIFGDFSTPPLINNFARGTFRNPQALGTIWAKVIFDKADQNVVRWMARNMCRQTCKGVFVRGQVVSRRDYREPVMEMTDISFESKAGAAAAGSEVAEAVASKDRYGVAKPVLAPGTIPTREGWQGWASRIPPTSPGFDAAKSMWDNMVAHSEFMRQANADLTRAVIRGPQRPESFETYYRGVRDTGLSMLFKQFPYQGNTTAWPRVVLIVEEKPRVHGRQAAEFSRGGQTKTDVCWRLRAKVWTGPARSEDIAAFNWCFSETRFNVPYADVSQWGRTPKSNMRLIQATTGSNRTLGPDPPDTPLPGDHSYKSPFSYAKVMVGNVLLDMGFNYRAPDGRVWLLDE